MIGKQVGHQTKFKRTGKTNINILMFFFIWPFGSLIYSIINYRLYFSKNIVWFFTIFYGLAIVTAGEDLDAYRYSQYFTMMAEHHYSFNDIFGKLYLESTKTDIYASLLMYFVSRFTSNPQIFYGFVGLVFGYFYSRNIWILIENESKRISFTQGLLFGAFSFIVAIHSLQFIRFSTASVVLLYGGLLVILKNKNIGYFWILLTPFVHFSFVYPAILFVIYKFIPKKIDLFIVLFIFSTFVIETKLGLLTDLLNTYVPSFLQEKVDSYTNPLYASHVVDSLYSSNWYIAYRSAMLSYLSYIYIAYIYIQGRRLLVLHREYYYLFCFILFFYSVSNILGIIPSMDRFINVSLYFLFAFIIMFYRFGPRTNLFKFINFISLPILIVYIVVGIRIAMETSGFTLFIGNPVIALVYTETEPIIEAIKRFINFV